MDHLALFAIVWQTRQVVVASRKRQVENCSLSRTSTLSTAIVFMAMPMPRLALSIFTFLLPYAALLLHLVPHSCHLTHIALASPLQFHLVRFFFT
jgi:hypothetical protein